MEIYGTYESTIYCNAENNYTIFTLRLSQPIPGYSKCKISCKGYIDPSYIGLPLLLDGAVKNESEFTNFVFTRAVPYSASEQDVINFPVFKNVSKLP